MVKKWLASFMAVFLFFMVGCTADDPGNVSDNDPSIQDENKQNDTDENNDKGNVDKQEENNNTDEDSTNKDPENENSKNGETNTNEKPRDGPNHANLEGLEVHYIDVGQADSTLLKFSQDNEEYVILIDAGNWNSSNVVNYLNSQGISKIDILVGTHPDADHIGQMDKIINNFDVDEVWMSGNTSTSQTFNRVLDAIDSNDVGYHEPRAGEIYDVGPLVIEVLNPTSATGDRQNESIALMMTYGEVKFLFTGDAEEAGERKMLNSGKNLQADIFQAGHHGSDTSNTSAFLDKVKPKVIIFSAGKNNSYGHPHDTVINRVKDKGIKMYSTAVNGTIIVKTDGKTYDITTKKDGNVTPSSSDSKSSNNNSSNNDSKNNNSGSSGGKKDEKPKEPKDESSTGEMCVNINTASFEELQQIIHIGPVRAEELIKLRPFSSVDDLVRIKGIAAGRLADIKSQGLACVGG